MANGKRGLVDRLPRLFVWIGSAIAFVGAVVGFIKLALGDTGLVTAVLLISGWLGAVYLVFKQTTGPAGEVAPQYPRLRRPGLATLVLIPLLSLAVYGYYRSKPPKAVAILVASFGQDPGEKADEIKQGLEKALGLNFNIGVLDRVITDHRRARIEGGRHKAQMVVWGSYKDPNDLGQTDLDINFEMLLPPKILPVLDSSTERREQVPSLSELESVSLRVDDSKMMEMVLFIVGMYQYSNGHWGDAIDKFDRSLHPKNKLSSSVQSFIYYFRGNAYRKCFYQDRDQSCSDPVGDTKNLDQAIANYEEAINRNQRLTFAYNSLGTIYAEKGDPGRAIVNYEHAIFLDEGYADPYNNRGNLYAKRGDLDQAIEQYNRAIERKRDDADPYYNLGNIYVTKAEKAEKAGQDGEGDLDRAIEHYSVAIKLKPDDAADPHYELGNIYVTKAEKAEKAGKDGEGDLDRAIKHYSAAINLKPEDAADPHEELGNIYVQKGDLDQAIKEYNAAINLKPGDLDIRVRRGLVYIRKNQLDPAIDDLKYAFDLLPEQASPLGSLENCYIQEGDLDQAIADCTRAIELNSKDVGAYIVRGLAYVRKSNLDLAIADLVRALELR